MEFEEPMMYFEGSDGKRYRAKGNSEAMELAKAAAAEGIELKAVKAHEGETPKEEKWWSWKNLGEGVKGLWDDPTGEHGALAYMGLNLASGLGTAVGVVGRGLLKGATDVGFGLARGAARGVETLVGAEGHAVSGFLKDWHEEYNEIVDAIMPGDQFEKRGMYNGIEGAREVTGAINSFAESVYAMKGMGLAARGAGAIAKAGMVGKGATGLAAAKAATQAARIGQAVVAAGMGGKTYAEMAADPEGPGGWRQEAAAAAAGGLEALTFGLMAPFKKMNMALPKPFEAMTRMEIAKRFAGECLKSGFMMGLVEAEKKGAEALATVGTDKRWHPETFEQALKSVGSQFLVGMAFHAVGAVGKAGDYLKWRGGEKGKDVALSFQVEQNRKIYAPRLHEQAQLALRAREVGAQWLESGMEGTENVKRLLPSGGVEFNDGSVWQMGRDGRATITVSDGTILDARTGAVEGMRANREAAAPEETGSVSGDSIARKRAENAGLFLDLLEQGKLPTVAQPLDGLQVKDWSYKKGTTLDGEWDQAKAQPVIVWVGNDGTRVLVTGQSRAAEASRSGAKEIKAVEVREDQGWSREQAESLDAVENMREGRGTREEIARGVEMLGIKSEEDCDRYGIVPERPVLDAITVANEGSEALRGAASEGTVGQAWAAECAGRLGKRALGSAAEKAQATALDMIAGKLPPEEAGAAMDAIAELAARKPDYTDREAADAIRAARERAVGRVAVDADSEMVEMPDGTIKSVAEAKAEGAAEAQEAAAEGKTVDESGWLPKAPAAPGADKAAEPTVKADGSVGCVRFEGAKATRTRSEDGREIVLVEGMTGEEMMRPENRDAAVQFVTRLKEMAGDVDLVFADVSAADAAEALLMAARVKARAEARSNVGEAGLSPQNQLVDAGQRLVDGLFGEKSGIRVRTGKREEAEAALPAAGETKPIKDAEGQVKGYYHRGKGEVVLFEGADAGTLAHEIGWHAVWHWAEQNSPDLLLKMKRYAARTPLKLKALIKEVYGDFKGDALMDEIGAGRFERAMGERFQKLLAKSPEVRGWWRKVLHALARAWKGMARTVGGNRVDLKKIEKMDPEEAIEALTAQMLEGRRLGEGRGNAEGDIRYSRAMIGGKETAVAEGYPLSIREARDPEKVLGVLSPLVGKSAAQIGEMKLTRINAKSIEHMINSEHARADIKRSGKSAKKIWRGTVAGMSVTDDIVATSTLGTKEQPKHLNAEWKKGATFYRAKTRFAVETEEGRYEIYPCELIVAEKNGERIVYDITEIGAPTLSAAASQIGTTVGSQLKGGATAHGGVGATPQSISQQGGGAQGEIRAQIKKREEREKGVGAQTDSQQFKRWFADSKVVDENGEPLVVYRGSPYDPLAQEAGKGVIKPEAYFTADPEYAKRYTGNGGKVGAYYLNIRRPFDIRDPECLKDLQGIYPDHEFIKGKSGALDWGEASIVDGEFLRENFGDKYDGIVYDEGGDPTGSGVKYRGVSYVPLDGGAQVKSATENIGTFDPGNPDIRYARGGKRRDEVYDDVLKAVRAGSVRVAAGKSERTDAGWDAGANLYIEREGQAGPSQDGSMTLAYSEALRLYRALNASAHMPKVLEKMPHLATRDRKGRLKLNAAAFGIVDRSDMEAVKAGLKKDGMFLHEDAEWRMRNGPEEVRAMKEMSEMALQEQLENLAEARVKGKMSGGGRTAVNILAKEIGRIACELPATAGAPKSLKDLRALGMGIAKELGDPKGELGKEAAEAAKWWREQDPVRRDPTATKSDTVAPSELWAEMFGMFLADPVGLEAHAPKVYERMVEAIAGNEKLSEAWNALRRTRDAEGPHERVMRDIERQWQANAEATYKELREELDKPIGNLGKRFHARLLLEMHSTEGPMMMWVSDAVKVRLKELKQLKKKGKIGEEEYRTLTESAKGELNKMRNALLVKQSGGGAWKMYALDFASGVLEDIKRDGVKLDDLERYLYAKNVRDGLHQKGKAAALGMDAREADMVLRDMQGRLGTDGWAKLETAAKRFQATREQYILDDPFVEEAFGKELVGYWRMNASYVRSERTWTAEEVEAYRAAREDWMKRHPGESTVIGEIEALMDMHALKGSDASGSSFTKPLVGSLKAVRAPVAATIENDMRIVEFAQRNHWACQIAETAKELGLEGFAVMEDHGGGNMLRGNNRYGSVTFLKDGRRMRLVMPKVVAEGFEHDARGVSGIVKINRWISAVLTQYSMRFAVRNIWRNRASNANNIAWMGEGKLVGAAGLAGLRPIARLATFLMERAAAHLPDKFARNALMNVLYGGKTNIHWEGQATRIVDMMKSPQLLRQRAEEANRLAMAGKTAKAEKLWEDIELCQKWGKLPIFGGVKSAMLGRGGEGDIDDVMHALGMKTNFREAELKGMKRVKRWMLEKAEAVRRFNDYEETRVKVIALLAARHEAELARARGREAPRSAEEITYQVATMSGSPRYQNRGRAANYLEFALGPFMNVGMKGAWRTLEAMRYDPKAWWTKAASRIAGRLATSVLWMGGGYAVLAKMLGEKAGDDEEKQKEAGWLMRFGRRMAHALANCSDYRLRNYDLVPVGLYGKWSTLAISMPRGDEDKLIMPAVDLLAHGLLGSERAQEAGFSLPMDLNYNGGKAFQDTVFNSGLLPDFWRRGIIATLYQDVIGPLAGQNPMNSFTQRTVYSQADFDSRWTDPWNFAKKVGKQLWNDLGGQVVMPSTTWDEDEGAYEDQGKWALSTAEEGEEGCMPIGGKTIFQALHSIPFVSAAASGIITMQNGGNERIARRLEEYRNNEPLRATANQISKEVIELVRKNGIDYNYAQELEERIGRLELPEEDKEIIEHIAFDKVERVANKMGMTFDPIEKVLEKMSTDEKLYRRALRQVEAEGWDGDFD